MSTNVGHVCVQALSSAKLCTSAHAKELQTLQTAHEQAESKLRAELQKKQVLLSTCRSDSERLRDEIQSLKAAQKAAAVNHAQHTEALQGHAICQNGAACILRCLAMACRITLRSSAAMRAGALALTVSAGHRPAVLMKSRCLYFHKSGSHDLNTAALKLLLTCR
jgi:hypothetical protein